MGVTHVAVVVSKMMARMAKAKMVNFMIGKEWCSRIVLG